MVSLGRMSVSTYGLNLAVAMAMAMANGLRQSGRSALSACPCLHNTFVGSECG